MMLMFDLKPYNCLMKKKPGFGIKELNKVWNAKNQQTK